MWSPVWIWESEIPSNICDQIIHCSGKIENEKQYHNRNQSNIDWSTCIEDFSCAVNGERKYTQEQYLKKISYKLI